MAQAPVLKPPASVTVNDDDPKSGYITVFLECPGLKVKRSLLGGNKAENADINIEITDSNVCVSAAIKSKEGISFQYKKCLPEDISAANSSHKIKDGVIVLKLCKTEAVSWSPHVKYLMSTADKQ